MNDQTKTNAPKEETPTVAFHFENEGDTIMGIETATYPNNNQVKRFKLSSGETVIVRELFGRDMMQIDKLLAGENNDELKEEKFFYWGYHFAVKVDGKQIPMEDFGNFKAKDYTKIKLAYQALNF